MPRILSAIAGVLVVAIIAPVSAQQAIATVAGRPLASRARAVATIQGTALNAADGTLAETAVRVRDARLGHIVNQSLTDKLGSYSFKELDPGNYVIEIVSSNQTTVAATNIISANAGETVTANVKLAFKPSMLKTILGPQSSSPAKDAGASVSSSATAGAPEPVPQITEQLPQVLVPAIPAVIPAPTPVSDR
jgi:hypothetical protein